MPHQKPNGPALLREYYYNLWIKLHKSLNTEVKIGESKKISVYQAAQKEKKKQTQSNLKS